MSQNSTDNAQTEASATETPNKTINITDVLGFGKVIDKLPLHKLTARMAYCMGASIVVLMFVGGIALSGIQFDGFPTAWDLRGAIILAVVLFVIGIWDLIVKKTRT